MSALPIRPWDIFRAAHNGPEWHGVFFDFNDDRELLSSVWTATVTNSSFPTAVDDAQFGSVTLTNTTADNDRIEVSGKAELFLLAPLKPVFFICRAKLTTPTQVDAGFGIGKKDTAWLGDSDVLSDGVWFAINDAEANWKGHTARDATLVSQYSTAADLVAADNAYHVFAWLYEPLGSANGAGIVRYFYDDVQKGYVQSTNLPYDDEMSLMFGIQQGEGTNAKSMSIDYIGCWQKR
jgi:hypothetical protein